MTKVLVPEELFDANDAVPVITAWLVRDAERVGEGDLLAEMMVEKVAYELRSPAAGVLRQRVAAEEPLTRRQVVAEIESG
jgi:pyruvate/2-oxoglutarate dehydrogenase complex dihydrolipoamide acyltransferase (E2) component